MKKTSLFYLLMFMFAFILPSFSVIPKEKEFDKNNVTQTTSDSLTVSVLFSNPELIVKDDRKNLEQKIESQLSLNKEFIDVMREFNIKFSELAALQERRNEPILARLEQQTGYSVGQINKFILQKNVESTTTAVVLAIECLLLITLYVTSYRRLNGSTITLVVVAVITMVSSLMVLKLCWPALMGKDYILFYKLVELSPF